MKFTLSWLKSHLETDKTLDEIVEKLSLIGLEVEGVEERAKGLETFKVAQVLEASQHPDADKLRLLKVDNGDEVFQVVCGAPNARAGMKGVFATSGSYIPGLDVTLKPTKIRGIESFGMMLSEREMGLSEDHDGIVDLPEDAPVGKAAVEVMGLSDPIIEIAITPNRGDCAGVRGVARDLAAAGFGTLKPLDTTPVAKSFDSPKSVVRQFDDASNDACPYFIGRTIRGVKNRPSPKWLQDWLKAVGLRPISALVDVTNFFSQGLCRPLHVFDASKLEGDVVVRFANDGETLVALDEKTYTLEPGMTVICDSKRPHAIGGIMGGLESGCTLDTTDVFLECAYFDPIRTAITGRKLEILSDARYRFERGVDPEAMIDYTEMATRLILELCGGEASELIVAGQKPAWQRNLTLRHHRIQGLGGVGVAQDEVVRILNVLGCQVEVQGDSYAVQPPAWRNDIEQEVCLIEEILRINGFENIEAVSVERLTALPQESLTPLLKRRSTARRILVGRGMVEAVTYAFLAEKQAALFAPIKAELKLSNPISADLDVMRPSLLANLIAAAQRNADRNIANAALFECGPVFHGTNPEDQPIQVGGIRTAATGPRNWSLRQRKVDVFDAKADVEAVLGALGANVENLQVDTTDLPSYYHPGRAGALKLGPKNTLAYFGELHPRVVQKMGFKGICVGFEINLDNIPEPKAKKTGAARPKLELSAFQPVERDFAFVVDKSVPAAEILRAAKAVDKNLISDAIVFDVFEGGNLGEDKKSIAISLTLQPMKETLTDKQIEEFSAKVITNVEKKTGGTLRG